MLHFVAVPKCYHTDLYLYLKKVSSLFFSCRQINSTAIYKIFGTTQKRIVAISIAFAIESLETYQYYFSNKCLTCTYSGWRELLAEILFEQNLTKFHLRYKIFQNKKNVRFCIHTVAYYKRIFWFELKYISPSEESSKQLTYEDLWT